MEKTLEDLYQKLYRIVLRQRRSLENENLSRLEELTREKEAYIKKLAELEESTNILEHEANNIRLRNARNRLVKEDRAFIELLREKEKGLIRKMKQIQETKGNLNNIGTAYGKKFSAPNRYLDEKC